MSQNGQTASQAHLSSEEIVGYIDQTMTERLRREVESHLAECQACLSEVLEVREFLRKQV